MSVNRVILVGRLGQDPELKYTPGGAAVCNFSLATNDVWVDKAGNKQEKTEWHRIVVWGKVAETCNQYLKKGREVYLEGKIQTRSYEQEGVKKYITEIVASAVRFLGNNAPTDSERTATPEQEVSIPADSPFSSDEIPF